jgi:hypothetical protein
MKLLIKSLFSMLGLVAVVLAVMYGPAFLPKPKPMYMPSCPDGQILVRTFQGGGTACVVAAR